MNFVHPLSIVKITHKGSEVNFNYYEDQKLLAVLYPFIISTLQAQIDFDIDSFVCYCIGSGGNYSFYQKSTKSIIFLMKLYL